MYRSVLYAFVFYVCIQINKIEETLVNGKILSIDLISQSFRNINYFKPIF